MICVVTMVRGLGFNWWVLLSLLAVLTVSVVVFNWQVRRWTTHRTWHALLDWSRARGFRLSQDGGDVPPPFDRLSDARMLASVFKGSSGIFQLETRAGSNVEPPRWHVLVRDLPAGAWPATGLRPANAKGSLLDLFSLSSFPGMGEVDRFMIFGTDSVAAKLLSASPARALLPPDIGLLLSGTRLALDFSSRPFDPIELGRMTALADQLVAHLPLH
jgi:hypothetical protein